MERLSLAASEGINYCLVLLSSFFGRGVHVKLTVGIEEVLRRERDQLSKQTENNQERLEPFRGSGS